MAGIISAVLILVTAIGFIAPDMVFAEGENDQAVQTVQPEGQAAPAEVQPVPAEGQPAQPTDQAAAAEGQAAQPTDQAAAAEGQAEQPADQAAAAEGQTAQSADQAAATEGDSAQAGDQAAAAEGQTAQPEAQSSTPAISSSSYIVMSGSTSEVIIAEHEERKMQPGCITLLMTAMVAIDNMYNEDELNNTFTVDEKLMRRGDTYRLGEEITIRDLLNAMLVGGDVHAAEALSRYSASKRDIFINEMNSKCMELGLMDTQFDNPGGTYSQKQYSTAKDLAVIVQAAMRYQLIREALSLRSVTVTAMSKSGDRVIEFASSDPLMSEDPAQGYKYIEGGISGALGAPVNASQFAAVAIKDDMQYICILMDSKQATMAAEAKSLLEEADTKATKNVIVKKGKRVGHARIKGGEYTRVPAYTASKGFAYVPPEGSEALIQTQVVMFDGLEAPMKEGDKVGEFRIFVADELKGTVDIIIKKDVPKGWLPSKIYISNLAVIIIAAIIGLAILLFIRIETVKKQRARRREAMRRQKIREIARKQLEIDEDRRRRNWTGTGYAELPPRTTDIRREQMRTEIREKENKQ